MHSGQSRHAGNGPLRSAGIRAANRRGFRGSDARIEIDGKLAAHSVVILPDEPQRIGQGSGAPSQIEFGRLKARGRPGNRAAQAERADILQLHAGAHGPRFQVKLPAARAILLDAARNVDQREGALVVPLLEIDAPAIHVDSVRARRADIARRGQRAHKAGARAGRRSGWQPALDIPVALGVARQIQTGPRQRNGTELEASGEQGRPAQAGRERIRAQEIFVAEVRIVRDADEMGLDPGAVEQTEIEPGNIDGAAKARGEVRDQVAARGAGPQGARKSEARGEEQHAADQNRTQPFSLGHRGNQELLQKAGKKKSAASVNFMQHPRPARPRRQMQNGIEEIQEPGIHVPVRAVIPSPSTDQ